MVAHRTGHLVLEIDRALVLSLDDTSVLRAEVGRQRVILAVAGHRDRSDREFGSGYRIAVLVDLGKPRIHIVAGAFRVALGSDVVHAVGQDRLIVVIGEGSVQVEAELVPSFADRFAAVVGLVGNELEEIVARSLLLLVAVIGSDKQIHRIDLHVLAQAGRTIFQHRRSALVAYAQRPAVLQLADRHDADHTVLGSHFHTQVAERLLVGQLQIVADQIIGRILGPDRAFAVRVLHIDLVNPVGENRMIGRIGERAVKIEHDVHSRSIGILALLSLDRSILELGQVEIIVTRAGAHPVSIIIALGVLSRIIHIVGERDGRQIDRFHLARMLPRGRHGIGDISGSGSQIRNRHIGRLIGRYGRPVRKDRGGIGRSIAFQTVRPCATVGMDGRYGKADRRLGRSSCGQRHFRLGRRIFGIVPAGSQAAREKGGSQNGQTKTYSVLHIINIYRSYACFRRRVCSHT